MDGVCKAMQKAHDIDIAKNIRIIEWLKSELLVEAANLFKVLAKGGKVSQSTISDILASIITVCYLLGKRLGINYVIIDEKIRDKIRLGILEEHEVEKTYGDLKTLKNHLDTNRS
jgi:uncharacterized membrane protein YwaF